MTERPQVLSLTAGARTIHLDTRTVARALAWSFRVRFGRPHEMALTFRDPRDIESLWALRDTIRDLCGPDHLAAVLRDDGTTTDTE